MAAKSDWIRDSEQAGACFSHHTSRMLALRWPIQPHVAAIRYGRILATAALAALLAGCMTPEPGPAPDRRPVKLKQAEALFERGQYAAAMIECVDLARRDPLTPGLAELQTRIMTELTRERERQAELRASLNARRILTDARESAFVPDTYRLRRSIRGLTGPLRTAPSQMQQILNRPVSVHLNSVTLADFILAIGATENINIVADDVLLGAADPKTLTLHAENVPLAEILEYVSRNLEVRFYVGSNIIWVSPGPAAAVAQNAPMETRVYRLRKGLSGAEAEDGELGVVAAIEMFVPEEEGARRLFNPKAHVLIARDTVHNLAAIEDLIEALDVCPPQILIEARFISVDVANFREMGIDWILDSDITVSRKGVLHNNQRVTASKTTVGATDPDNIVGFPASELQKSQGLNFTFHGLLTDPQFRAVVHALETSGQAQTLSSPKIATVNNREARVWMGERIPYFESTRIEHYQVRDPNTGDWISQTRFVPDRLQWLEPGYELLVTPSVGSDLQSINLKLAPEISELKYWENFNGDMKVPVTAHRLIETEVVVFSGETVAMGGLVTSSENQIEKGVPLLSQVPLIGRLFRHNETEVEQKNLLIFVTATIISEQGETLIPLPLEAEVEAEAGSVGE